MYKLQNARVEENRSRIVESLADLYPGFREVLAIFRRVAANSWKREKFGETRVTSLRAYEVGHDVTAMVQTPCSGFTC
jgi:hypothetical protein